MSNAEFPTLPGLGWSMTRTPIWSTKIQKATSGKETRAAFQSFPLYKFTLTYEVLRGGTAYQEYQTLLGFYNQRQGSYDDFLFTFAGDSSVAAQNFGTGDGATTTFQLIRNLGGFLEPVQNLNGAPSIYVNGTLKTVTTDYAIGATGIVAFVTAPAVAAALTWSGSFYYRCRFAADQYDFEQFYQDFWALKKVELLSVKL
jgi:uncharacterized protein (TIGR02217 family)